MIQKIAFYSIINRDQNVLNIEKQYEKIQIKIFDFFSLKA